MLAAPVLLSVALAAGSASAAAADANSIAAQESVAAGWQLWDSYTSASLCNNIGAMGQLGGAWSDFSCSYVPVDDQPYWLWVFI